MSDIVDRKPFIKERLRELAAEFEPKIDALERAVADGDANRSELLVMKLRYKRARSELNLLRDPGLRR